MQRNIAPNYNFYCIMTKEEFEVLQLDLQQSGKSIKDYLLKAGVLFHLQLLAKEVTVKR